MTRNTGFASGLYDETESDSSKIKGKEAKVGYLNKLVTCVAHALGEPMTVRPGKIVAGLEAEQTNHFLQQLARAARAGGAAGEEAVRRTLAGEAPGGAKPQEQQPEQRQAPPPEQTQPRQREQPRQSQQQQQQQQQAAPPQQAPPRLDDDPRREIEAPKQRKEPQRPSSARKAPPKVRSTEVAARKVAGAAPVPVPRAQVDAPPAAEPAAAPAVAVIGEGEGDDDDDTEVVVATDNAEGPTANVEGAGKLVRDIMAAKEEMTDAAGGAAPEAEADMGPGIVIKSRRKSKAANVPVRSNERSNRKEAVPGGAARKMQDVGAIKEAVQGLVQSTTPLGKVIDYLQEDLANMSKEMQFWVNEEKAYAGRVDEERRATEDIASGFEGQQRELDDEVAAMEAKIAAARAEMMHNDQRIQRMIQALVSV